jgi:hypothetical protein
MFKLSVGQGSSGKKKLKVGPLIITLDLTNHQVLRAINASLFIDDHHGNLEPILNSHPQIPCLLFGKYGWNMHRSGAETPAELMSHAERIRQGFQLPREEIEMVEGLERTEGWDDVIRWVKAWDRAAEVKESGSAQ